jgi:hypothetical protein
VSLPSFSVPPLLKGFLVPEYDPFHSARETPKTPPCFEDFPPPPPGRPEQGDEEEEMKLAPQCEGVTEHVPCPRGGNCLGGVLTKCTGKNYEASKDKDACVLTDEAKLIVGSMAELLEKWTVYHECQAGGNPFVESIDEESGRPLFLYTQLSGELELGYDLNLAKSANDEQETFLLVHDKTNMLIGLHPSKHVSKPLKCWIAQGFSAAFGWIVAFAWTAVTVTVVSGKDFVAESSGTTKAFMIAAAGALWWWMVYQKEKADRRKLLLDVIRVRELVWAELSTNHTETPALPHHVCERIVWRLFPSNRKQRNRLIHQVWPHVSFLAPQPDRCAHILLLR